MSRPSDKARSADPKLRPVDGRFVSELRRLSYDWRQRFGDESPQWKELNFLLQRIHVHDFSELDRVQKLERPIWKCKCGAEFVGGIRKASE